MKAKSFTYIKYEIIRTFRNRRFLIFSLAFPLVLYLLVAGENRHVLLTDIPFPLYYMTGMVAWGSMVAVTSIGARISLEKQVGWSRQMRITPLPVVTYFRAKIFCGYLTAILSIVVLYGAGLSFGVHLSVLRWISMTVMILIGLIPFAVLGILIGHLISPDSMGPALGGITALMALLGGSFGPIATHGLLFEVVKDLPSYWLVHAAKSALTRSSWPPMQSWVVIAIWAVALAFFAFHVYQRDTQRAT